MSDYKILKVLSDKGELGGSVQLIEYYDSGERYVLKKIPHLDNPLHRAIFDKEISALRRLNSSPNIVKLITHDFGTIKKTGVKEGRMILEYIEGSTLQDINFNLDGPLTRFQIMQQLIIALRCAHENSVIHRDVNPRNIMITEESQAKLIDFGICKIKGLIQQGTTYQFATNKYAAPEVVHHSENATDRSDIFSLGAVLYFLFTNSEPPLPKDFHDVIAKATGIDVELRPILQKMTAFDPEERYENLVDLEIDLAPIFGKYLSRDERYLVAVPLEKFDYLRKNSLVVRTKKNIQLLQEDISSNFSNAYVHMEERDGQSYFVFDGINYSMQCLFEKNYFQVLSFKKLDIVYRERNKRFSLPVSGKLVFCDTISQIKDTFESFQLNNRILSHTEELRSARNINDEYNNSYGFWREYIDTMIAGARNRALRFNYDKFIFTNGKYAFTLNEDSRIGDESITRETEFVFESLGRNGKLNSTQIGIFEGYEDDGSVMLIKPPIRPKKGLKLPKNGCFCINYGKEIYQYKLQGRALNDIFHDELYIKNLKGILIGIESPIRRPQLKALHYFDKKLDFSQKRAVEKILTANEIALIQGPPGTGKTNVLLEVVRQILRRNEGYPLSPEKVLIVSQSHAAVDKIIEDLDPYIGEVSLIRIGKDDNLTELSREKYSLENRKERWIQSIINKSIEKLKAALTSNHIEEDGFIKYAEAFEKSQISGLSNSDDESYQIIISEFLNRYSFDSEDNLLKRLQVLYKWINFIEESDDLDGCFVNVATVVAGTCSGFISNSFVKNIEFDYVIVDEAAKATYPELMVSMVRAKKVILVGDHRQLPPVFDRNVLNSAEARLEISKLEQSGFGKIFDIIDNTCKETLSTQYRMHPCIGSMISKIFYPDVTLQNGVTAEERVLEIPMLAGIAILWIATSNLPPQRRQEERIITPNGNASFANPKEVEILIEYLKKLDGNINDNPYSIGVITPYRAQLELIRRRIKSIVFNNISVEINTVDAFQGSQKDIILYSTVRSSSKATIGFLSEQSRLNVSFSRARSCLIIIGDIDFLSNTSIRDNRFPEIINYMKDNGDYCKIINY